jgi:hypothetical protein
MPLATFSKPVARLLLLLHARGDQGFFALRGEALVDRRATVPLTDRAVGAVAERAVRRGPRIGRGAGHARGVAVFDVSRGDRAAIDRLRPGGGAGRRHQESQGAFHSYDFMILRPAVRFLMSPRPPADFAARRLAAVMRPPLLFFMACSDSSGDGP